MSRDQGLAAAIGVTSGAITRIVDTLRSAGWVGSEVNAADRRARIIRLTDAAATPIPPFGDCVLPSPSR